MTAASLLAKADRAYRLAATAAAGFCLALAVAAGFWQVLSRFLLANPSVWSEALVRLALIWMVMIGLGLALRRGAMVSIDIAESLSSGRIRTAIRLGILAANATLLTALVWLGWAVAVRVSGQEMAGLEISMAWGYAAIPVGCLVGLWGAVANFIDDRHSGPESVA